MNIFSFLLLWVGDQAKVQDVPSLPADGILMPSSLPPFFSSASSLLRTFLRLPMFLKRLTFHLAFRGRLEFYKPSSFFFPHFKPCSHLKNSFLFS